MRLAVIVRVVLRPCDKITFEVSEIITLPNGRLLVTLIRAAVCLLDPSLTLTFHILALLFERHAELNRDTR